MEIEFDVKMTVDKMYDYMLQHTFSTAQGIIGECVGVLLLLLFLVGGNWIYLLLSLIVISYLPVTLYLSASRQVKLNPAFQNALHYTLTAEGVKVRLGENEEFQAWADMYRAKSTKKSIIVYTTMANACIFPRSDMGEQTQAAIQMISAGMKPDRVKIRY